MTPEDALAWIHWGGSTGRFALTAEARLQMAAKNLSIADVRCALEGARSCARHEDRGWVVESADLDGLELILHVLVEERVIVLELL